MPGPGHGGDLPVRVALGEVPSKKPSISPSCAGKSSADRASARRRRAARGQLVGAGRPADAEVDAAGVQRLEHPELLGDHERGVVGQHHAARAQADGRGGAGDVGQQHGGDELAMPGMLWCSATQYRR